MITNLVDRITYMARLATRPEDIDGILDPLRRITSRSDFSPTALSAKDEAALQEVRNQLEDYLVTREPVRLFTRETLRLQLEQQSSTAYSSTSRWLWLVGIGAAAGVGAIAAALIPGLSTDVRLMVAVAVVVCLIYIGAAILFAATVSAFKSELRRAFIMICLATAALGLGLVQLPVIEAFNLDGSIFETVAAPIPFMLAFLGMSLGIRTYAIHVGVKHWLLSIKLVLGLGVVTPLVLWALIHTFSVDKPTVALPLATMIASITLGWLLLFVVMSAVTLPKIVKKIADLYKPPIRALGRAVYSLFIAMGYASLSLGVEAFNQSAEFKLFGYVLLIASGVSFVWAAYAFNRVTRYY